MRKWGHWQRSIGQVRYNLRVRISKSKIKLNDYPKGVAVAGFILAVALLLAGCSPSEPTPLTAVSTNLPIEPSISVPTSTVTIAAEPVILTAVPTPAPPATLTPIPTANPHPTQSPTLPPVRFAVIGDYGLAGENAAAVAALVKGWQPDFIITTGDNNYPNGSAETIDENIGQYYADYIFPYTGAYGPGATEQNRFFPTLGNHDWGNSGIDPYLTYFELPGNERYYDFSRGAVHLFALNTDSREPDGVSANSIQAIWLQSRLATSDRPWKIVYGHLSPYASGTHGGIAWMDWPFQAWGATALLAAHDHVYERIMRNGFPYVINGLGGGPRYLFEEIVVGSEVRYRDSDGAMLITADWQTITFEFYTTEGNLIDSFSLTNNN